VVCLAAGKRISFEGMLTMGIQGSALVDLFLRSKN